MQLVAIANVQADAGQGGNTKNSKDQGTVHQWEGVKCVVDKYRRLLFAAISRKSHSTRHPIQVRQNKPYRSVDVLFSVVAAAHHRTALHKAEATR